LSSIELDGTDLPLYGDAPVDLLIAVELDRTDLPRPQSTNQQLNKSTNFLRPRSR
jgi:hypothetical protein